MEKSKDEILKEVWESSISKMSLQRVREILVQMGLPKSMYQKMEVEQAQKVVLGMLTRIDGEAFDAAMSMLRR